MSNDVVEIPVCSLRKSPQISSHALLVMHSPTPVHGEDQGSGLEFVAQDAEVKGSTVEGGPEHARYSVHILSSEELGDLHDAQEGYRRRGIQVYRTHNIMQITHVEMGVISELLGPPPALE